MYRKVEAAYNLIQIKYYLTLGGAFATADNQEGIGKVCNSKPSYIPGVWSTWLVNIVQVNTKAYF